MKIMVSSSAILSLVVFMGLTGSLPGQSDLPKLIELIDQDKTAAFNEIKQLREKNSQNPKQAALFDFGYGLSALQLSLQKEAIEVLQPFVNQRPQIYHARMLLLRAYIDLEQFDNVALQVDKLLLNFPSQAESAQKVAKFTGTLVGFLNFARPDCSDELKNRLEQAAELKIPEEFIEVYREAISLVESRVATINDEIKVAIERVDLEIESKVASNLSEAEKLRKEAESQAEDLKERDTQRAEDLAKMKLDLQKLEQDYSNLTVRHNFLDNQVGNLQREQRSYERNVTEEDKNGKKTIRTEITNKRRHKEIGNQISNNRAEMGRLASTGNVLMTNYQQLRVQAAATLNQQQLDELFSKNKMQALGKGAAMKEKKAERESDRKGKSAVARVLSLKQKNFSTYEPLDVAWNREYLQDVAKKVQ